MSTPSTWHAVVPKIVDPELAPPGGRHGGLPPHHSPHGAPAPHISGAPGLVPAPGLTGVPVYGGYGPEKPRGFFQEHKFAIIVAVIVFVVVLVVLYLYLSQKGKRADKGAKGRPQGSFGAGDGGDGGPGASEEERINNAEMQKAFMMRQAARMAQLRAAGRRQGDPGPFQNDAAGPEGLGAPRDPRDSREPWQGQNNETLRISDPLGASPPAFRGARAPRSLDTTQDEKAANDSQMPPSPDFQYPPAHGGAPNPRSIVPARSSIPPTPTQNREDYASQPDNVNPPWLEQRSYPGQAAPSRGGREPPSPFYPNVAVNNEQPYPPKAAESYNHTGGSGANTHAVTTASSRTAGSVDILSGPVGPGMVEQRRVTWADNRAPQGGSSARGPKAPEARTARPSETLAEGSNSLFQQLAVSLEDEASGGP